MDAKKFHAAYHAGRNGCDYFVRHPIAIGGRFEFSQGVHELAEAGCYWMVDIVGTECLIPLRASTYPSAILRVTVGNDEKALMDLTTEDNKPPIWKKAISYTDMPPGQWLFELVDEGTRFALALLSEH
jgi:hypothetical protein